jgi:DNA-binding IclR family transcriptional regulator
MADEPKLGYQAPALEKGLEILEYLTDRTHPHAMAEIAKAVGRSRNEIYRVLIVLERKGFLERTEDDRYQLSNKLFELGMRTPPLRNLHDAALPLMHRLSERLMQSCHIAVISGADIIVVARVESPDQLGFAVRVGYRRAIHLTSSGRVLYAFQPLERKATLLRLIGLNADVAEQERFKIDCEKTLENGYFTGPSLFVDAVTDIGAPLFGGEEGAIASLVVPFVSGRSARCSLIEAIDDLRATALQITQRLTHG